MSNADQEDLVTTTRDGVTVEKSFEPNDFPVPAIAFVVRSERDETVSVRLVDFVPDDVPPEDIGFHPNYGAEFWAVEGDTIVFTRDMEPGEEYTTVYGLRGGDAADAEKFMTEPELDSVEPPLPADSGEAVREVMEDDDGDSTEETDGRRVESEPGDDDIESAISRVDAEDEQDAESEEDGQADEPDTSLDLGDPIEDSGPADDGSADGATADDSSAEASAGNGVAGETAGAGAVAVEGSLAETLADEIRSGDVDEDDLETLRSALGVEDTSGSVEARIDHLQSEMADVEAYAEAIEEFLDENGTAQQILDDLRSDLDATKERLDAIEGTAEEAVETAQSVEAELEERDEEADDETQERLEELEDEIESLSEELEDVAELRNRLASAIGGLDGSDDE